jgi:transcriptional regulator with XRE-family HTH domain
LTQQRLASLAGMDRSYVSDVERGEAMVSLESFLRICRGIGISAAKIVTEIESEGCD